ncbi:hypothetical protein BC567DRAFT_227841 [Phyllosticta citribraziliensis]
MYLFFPQRSWLSLGGASISRLLTLSRRQELPAPFFIWRNKTPLLPFWTGGEAPLNILHLSCHSAGAPAPPLTPDPIASQPIATSPEQTPSQHAAASSRHALTAIHPAEAYIRQAGRQRSSVAIHESRLSGAVPACMDVSTRLRPAGWLWLAGVFAHGRRMH